MKKTLTYAFLLIALVLVWSCSKETVFSKRKNTYRLPDDPVVVEDTTVTDGNGGSFAEDANSKIDSTQAGTLGDDGEETLVDDGNIDDPSISFPDIPAGDYHGVSPRFFEIINMDAPGLALVKKKYSIKHYYEAAAAYVKYLRDRNGVTVKDPNVDLSITVLDNYSRNIADQALVNKFFAGSYAISGSGETLDFYSVDDGHGGIDWDKVPAGVPDPIEYHKQLIRLQFMPYLAKAYYVTKEAKYVEAIVRIYDSYIAKYPMPDAKTNVLNDPKSAYYGLNVDRRMTTWPDVISYAVNSPAFKPEWLTMMTEYFYDAVRLQDNNWLPDQSGNMYFSQVEGKFYIAVFFPELKTSEQWAADAGDRTYESLAISFREDGTFYDLDLGYECAGIERYREVHQYCIQNNKEYLIPNDYFSILYKACRLILDCSYPNLLEIENFSDQRTSTYGSTLSKYFMYYHNMFPDSPEFTWASSNGFLGTAPSNLVSVYPGGYCTMRSAWKYNKGTMLICKNALDATGRWHCCPDNGHVVIWKDGRRFTPDAGSYTYENGSDRDYMHSTKNHNTLSRDFGTITDADKKGSFIHRASGSNYELVVLESRRGSGLTHRRAIYMVDKQFFVIVDEGYGSAACNVNVNWNLGFETKDFTIDSSREGSQIFGAYSNFSDNNNLIFITFADKNNGWKATSGTSHTSEVLSERTERRRYDVTITKKSTDKAARFITVIYPLGAAGGYQPASITASFTDNAAATAGYFNEKGSSVKVTAGGKTYNLSYTL